MAAPTRGRRDKPSPFAAPVPRRRLAVIVVLVFLGVIVLPTVGLMETNHLARQAVERRARVGNAQTAGALAAALGQSYQQRLAVLDDLPASPTLLAGLSADDNGRIESALRPVMVDESLCSLRLVRPGRPDVSVTSGDACWAAPPRPEMGTALLSLGLGVAGGQSYNAIQIPNVGGRKGTTLVAALPVSALLRPQEIADGGRVVVVAGTTVALSSAGEAAPGTMLSWPTAVAEVRGGRPATSVSPSTGASGSSIMAYQPVAGTDFGVFVNVPTDLAYAGANHLTHLLVAGYGGFLGLALVLTLLVSGLVRQRERAVAAGDRQIRALTDATPDGVVVIDPAGRVVFANPAITEMVGADSPEEVNGLRAREWFDGEPEQLAAARRALVADDVVPDIQLRMRTRQGGSVPIEAHTAPLELDGYRATISVVRDLTDRRRAEAALARTEDLQRVTLESAAEGIVFYDCEADGTVRPVLMNQACERLLGCDLERLTAAWRGDVDLQATDIAGRPLAAANAPSGVVARTGQRSGDIVFRVTGTDGPRWIRGSASPVRDGSGELVGVVATMVDLTGEFEGLNAARAERARFAALVEHGQDLVMVVDRQAVITYASPAFERILRRRPEDLLGTSSRRLLHPDDLGAAIGVMGDLAADRATTIELGCRVADADGHWHDLEVTAVNRLHDPAVEGMVLTGRDVTERARAAALLTQQATHDALTGLPNRLLLLQRMAEGADGQAAPSAGPGERAVLYADLDLFKHINDSFGHAVGDRVLVTLAERLTAVVGPDHTVARLGGDEFVVVADGMAGAAGALDLAHRVREEVARPIALGEMMVTIDASIGVALADGQDQEALLQQADTALYRAKANGRGRCVLFDDAMRTGARRRLVVEQLLRDALDGPAGPGSTLVLHHQPIVDLRSGELRGHEVLARLRDDRGGLVAPGEFIEVATEAQLIVSLGDAVLARACTQQARWLADGLRPGPFSVNLTAQQLADARLPDRIVGVLEANDVAADQLCLELTESSLIDSGQTALTTLAAVRELGIRIALDDFGTGWSSLAYLRRFPIDVVKIDRSFVTGLGAEGPGTSRTDRELVRAILDLGHALGLRVVAEGIETEAQARVLVDLGCELGQGYLFGRPAAAEDRGPSLLRGC